MASFYANASFSFYDFNLATLAGGTATFLDNVGFTSALGNVYPDAWRIDVGSAQRSYLLGTGFTVDAQQRPTGGTAQGFQENVWNGSAWVARWGIEGFALPVLDLFAAASTAGTGDDLALLARAFAGADLLRMSEQNDTARGFAGDDTIRGMGGNDVLFGDDGNDSVDGGAGSDLLYGNIGNDTLVGGPGSDTYHVGDADTVIETVVSTAPAEQDIVRATVGFVLPDNVEVLVLDGSEPIDGTGNAQANQLFGNGAANRLAGGGGNDVLRAGPGDDRLSGGAGNDSLLGDLGVDTMDGGSGNDSYFVDEPGDQVIEASALAGEIDVVSTSVTRTLEPNVENVFLVGADAIGATGNLRANRMIGNDAANTLRGLGGADLLLGQGGADALDGGAGPDTMEGGAGNDLYRVDDAADVVVETGTAPSEIDTVRAVLSWTLGANVERLVLDGSAPIAGTGNGLANRITGNAAANQISGGAGGDTLEGGAGRDTLDGGIGRDSMVGGAGSDTYHVDSVNDRVVESATAATDVDTVFATINWTLATNVEHLVLEGGKAIVGIGNALANRIGGSAADNWLAGAAGNDTLLGADGADTLMGGAGLDRLQGGAGNDAFRPSWAAGGASEVDTVVDFGIGDDRFDLDNAVFTALGGAGPLAASAFALGSVAADASVRIVYDAALGALRYDADGSGGAFAAVLFAHVAPGTVLTADDFWVV